VCEACVCDLSPPPPPAPAAPGHLDAHRPPGAARALPQDTGAAAGGRGAAAAAAPEARRRASMTRGQVTGSVFPFRGVP